ncbi:MAG TPA: nucleotidyltransferase domain-containing protein [Longimicrobium sp.]|nr:nucleotidyltransferase domain-containing protein [Longimicrobium sp.]
MDTVQQNLPIRSRTRPRIRSPKRTDALSATLASGALARVVIDFAVHPEDASHGREIQRRTGLTPRSLQTELARLESLGVVRRRPDGRLVRYELVEGNARWRALRALIRELADPVDVLLNALSDVPGIAAAFIFGSIARGDAREDSDVDVFIVDDGTSHDQRARRTIEAEILLGREVSVIQMTRDDLAQRMASGSSFVRNVLGGPKLWLVGSEANLQVAP